VVNVVIGPGSIGQAIARRVSVGKHVLLADLREENAAAAAKTLSDAGYEVSTATVDISSRDSIRALVERATAIGPVMGMIHAAGVSPSQASPTTILRVVFCSGVSAGRRYPDCDAITTPAPPAAMTAPNSSSNTAVP